MYTSADNGSAWPEPRAMASGGVRQLANELKYQKSHSLDFVVIVGVVEMPMPMARKMLGG